MKKLIEKNWEAIVQYNIPFVVGLACSLSIKSFFNDLHPTIPMLICIGVYFLLLPVMKRIIRVVKKRFPSIKEDK